MRRGGENWGFRVAGREGLDRSGRGRNRSGPALHNFYSFFPAAESGGAPTHNFFAGELADGSGCAEREGEGWAMGYIMPEEILLRSRSESKSSRQNEKGSDVTCAYFTPLTSIHSGDIFSFGVSVDSHIFYHIISHLPPLLTDPSIHSAFKHRACVPVQIRARIDLGSKEKRNIDRPTDRTTLSEPCLPSQTPRNLSLSA